MRLSPQSPTYECICGWRGYSPGYGAPFPCPNCGRILRLSPSAFVALCASVPLW
jgi:predicted RNA-binding Zn-ribbon protein involved in translation (DUF1610 family)